MNTGQVPEFKEKMVNKRREDGTLRSSGWEDQCYQELVAIFGEGKVLRNYQDDRYVNPETGWHWMVDFYVPEYDLFMELFGHLSHGGMRYDPANPECIKVLEKLGKAGVNLDIWTKIDPLKRSIASANGLNFLEGFTVNELIGRVKSYLLFANLGIKTA